MSVDRPRWPTKKELIPTSTPPSLLVDITNFCPLSCIQCPVPILRERPGYKPTNMSLETFQRLADQTSSGTVVTLSGDGEPMVVGKIDEMVKYATDRKIIIRLITSGLIMPDNKIKLLLQANINFIDFSLDAATQETYNKVRLDSNYDKVIGNVNRFLELRHEIQGVKPATKVLVNMIDQPTAHAEIHQFFDIWSPKVDRVYVRPLHSVAGFYPTGEDVKDTGNPNHRMPCRVLWDRLVVDYKGNVFHCPLGWGRTEAMVGNIYDDTIMSIWTGDKLRELREAHIAHTIAVGTLCIGCPDWKQFGWDQSSVNYLKLLNS